MNISETEIMHQLVRGGFTVGDTGAPAVMIPPGRGRNAAISLKKKCLIKVVSDRGGHLYAILPRDLENFSKAEWTEMSIGGI